MPDITLSAALQEAFASADPDAPIIDTLSIYYSGLLDDLGNPADLFIFNGYEPTRVKSDGVRELDARLEATAARHGGLVVTYTGIPFSITLSGTSTDPVPRATLTIDNIKQEMIDLLIAASQSNKAIEVIYRQYIVGSEMVGPENNPPIQFNLVDVEVAATTASGSLVTLTIGNRRFPFELYKASRFPTLPYA